MKVKTLSLLLIITAMIFVGTVCAIDPTPTPTSADQNIEATVSGYEITLTGPVDVSSWNLERGVKNEKDVGPVKISTTAPSTWTMKLQVSSDGDRLHADGVDILENPMFISDIAPPVPEDGWTQLTTGEYFLTRTAPAQTSPLSIPIRVRQEITPNDDVGEYSIKLTYTLSVEPPSP